MQVFRLKSQGKFYRDGTYGWVDDEDAGQLYLNRKKAEKIVKDSQKLWASRQGTKLMKFEVELRDLWTTAQVTAYDLVPSQGD